jgi:hypothetical protein
VIWEFVAYFESANDKHHKRRLEDIFLHVNNQFLGPKEFFRLGKVQNETFFFFLETGLDTPRRSENRIVL